MKAKDQQSKGCRSPEKRTAKRAAKSPGEDWPSSRSRAAAGKPLPKAPSAVTPPSCSPEKTGLAQSGKEAFSIVGIGASAGGLEAFMELLKHLPADSGLGFVLVQHLNPTHQSALTQLLGRVTAMPVSEVANGQAVLPNHVYVIPPNAGLVIQQGVLMIQPRQQTGGAQRSIDNFFQSLAEDQHERAIGVVLSGTATDGTLGLEAIKEEGGITFAQDGKSAKYDSMPRSAAAAGCVDFVLSPENIARELVRLARHPYLASVGTSPVVTDPNSLMRILLLLRNGFGVDFSLYKPSTIQRRLARRVVLNKLNTLEAYAGFLQGNAAERGALYADMLISVTSFFRNPEAFEALKRIAFPKLLAPGREEPVRIWVPGCSTGQEAYSLAMLFGEHGGQAPGRAPRLHIFATDLNEALLESARRGLYLKSLVQEVSPERLRRFFVEEDGGYRVSKRIRELCVFARQDILSDPPFSRMDLISCRNLLIYLEAGAQKKILPAFHYALKHEGYLFLGASESVGAFSGLFECADKQQKVFSKKPGPTPAFSRPDSRSPRAANPQLPSARSGGAPEGIRAEPSAQREADRVTLKQFAPPGVLVNAELQVLEFRGSTGAYLEPSAGKASFDLLRMAREGLALPLRAALNRAKKEDRTVRQESVRVRQNGGTRTVDLQIIPLKNLKERCYLVLFTEAKRRSAGVQPVSPISNRRRARSKGAAAGSKPASERSDNPRYESRRIAELERELVETRDERQSLQEEHGATDEEFQAANEELQSANEELQSINEELETSKEELESTNEELITVNEEMANRNAELNRLNSDLNNFQISVDLAVLLLGRDLTIRRFSPLAEKVFNLLASDVGRPISALKHNLDFPGLGQFVAQVIDTAQVEEHEVRDKEGRWYLLRARPYLALDNKIDGATLVLVDINALKLSEQAAEAARAGLEQLAEDKDELMGILTHDLKNLLSGLHMSAERLRDSSGSLTDPKLRVMVENISYSSSQMLAFVKEFLANASFGHGLTIKTEPVSLWEAAAGAVGQYQEAARRKGLVLHEVLPAENAAVQADPAALSQVLGNLLSNAVKFSPPGKEISIGVRSEDNYVECYVQDQGPGFKEEDKMRMFERYGRLSAQPTGAEPSAGLGLSIVKKLVEAMGGAVTCESTAGNGARFTVRLPKALQQPFTTGSGR
jgi:two-component system CheB/CheR fusion protein